jgi:hypothetical protein
VAVGRWITSTVAAEEIGRVRITNEFHIHHRILVSDSWVLSLRKTKVEEFLDKTARLWDAVTGGAADARGPF